MSPLSIALVGLGKITTDQHIPAIAGSDRFTLTAGVSPRGGVPGLQSFSSLQDLLANASPDAVAVNTPPQLRFALAREALLAGRHVLLEKPPCATVSELAVLQSFAEQQGLTIYTAWHSQHAPGVGPARAWLAGKTICSVTMSWCENVRHWHPGQQWIWEPGGLGVFDPGINGLSILAKILPCELSLRTCRFEVPANCQTPAVAELSGNVGELGSFAATLNFLQEGPQEWSIAVSTEQGSLSLLEGGARLSINGVERDVGPSEEYPSIYHRFAELIDGNASEVDARPLALTADAFLIAERVTVEEFFE